VLERAAQLAEKPSHRGAKKITPAIASNATSAMISPYSINPWARSRKAGFMPAQNNGYGC
jgi:hypothetical protein